MHRRFGLFGTERTGAGIIILRTVQPSPPYYGGSEDRVRETSEVVVGPEGATVPAIFAFSDPRACRCARLVTGIGNETPTQDTSPDYSGFPHTEACTPVQPEYQDKPAVHPTGESPHRTETGNADAVLPGQSANMVVSHLQTPIHEKSGLDPALSMRWWGEVHLVGWGGAGEVPVLDDGVDALGEGGGSVGGCL